MKLQEKNFVKMSTRFYVFARNSDKLHELLRKNAETHEAVETCGYGGRVAVGYRMDEIYAAAKKAYGNNLVIATNGPSVVSNLQAVTIEGDDVFGFEAAIYGDIEVVVLTKDRAPFGEGIDDVIAEIRKMLVDVANDAGAVFGEINIDGEVETVEFTGASLTDCEETPGERKARRDERRRMAEESAGDFFSLLRDLMRD